MIKKKWKLFHHYLFQIILDFFFKKNIFFLGKIMKIRHGYLQLASPTVSNSLFVSRASPISILIAAISSELANETTKTMPNQIGNILDVTDQSIREKSTKSNKLWKGTKMMNYKRTISFILM